MYTFVAALDTTTKACLYIYIYTYIYVYVWGGNRGQGSGSMCLEYTHIYIDTCIYTLVADLEATTKAKKGGEGLFGRDLNSG
jgi:hypothetical protein